MAFVQSHLWKCGAALALLFGFASTSQAWFDDFNDMSVTDDSPFSWSSNPLSPLFDGTYDASSGDYKMFPDDNTNPIGQVVSWNDDVTFTDTYARTQGVVLPDPNDPSQIEGNLVLLARLDPAAIFTYVLYFDVSGNLGVQRIEGLDGDVFDESVDIEFNASVESVIEFNVVTTEAGVELRGFAWQPDQPKPAEPQLVFVDDLPGTLASGKAGLAFAYDNHFGTSGIYRYAMAQDTPIIDALPGDYNGDGTVNAADYTVWRDGGSPDSTQAGYDLWKANFGNSGAGGGAAVPEPASIVCALLALVAVLRFRPATM